MKNSFDIFDCRSCRALFVPDRSLNLKKLYSKDYFTGAAQGFGYADYDRDKEAMRGTFEIYLAKIEKALPRNLPRRLLDVGAANGAFLAVAQKRNWEVRGVEVSDFAAAEGRKRGFDIKTGTVVEAKFPDAFFSVVTLWDVLEHIADPHATLKEITRITKGTGLVAVNTPDTQSLFAKLMRKYWHLANPPEHLILYNLENAAEMLKKYGYAAVAHAHVGKSFTLEYIFQTLSHQQKFFLWRFLLWLVARLRIRKLVIPVNVRDNFFLIAAKKAARTQRVTFRKP
ncbi:MAG: class I SAM-dependent methyltransferase [Candidatus Sungbacteria bacterium]|uniref:Class I SAM-dependent methyltransferase n=1 Tax=Candidatus Sungiibacteriota bacterium TaxID=2750080 RepID=A0A931WNR4_9BACT|nr:class I SAM-dependent methyltransferase [Candidatus Sungbacteria bacterium]